MDVNCACRIIGLKSEELNHETLRSLYKKSILKNHPDKATDIEGNAVFLKIQSAYEFLKQYLSQESAENSFAEIIRLSDSTRDEKGIYYLCRCGSRIELSFDYAFYECISCSLLFHFEMHS